MTRVLVLGAEGMAGRALMRELPDALGTTRHTLSKAPRTLTGIDVGVPADLRDAIDWAEPDVVINCVGIVKSECDKHTSDYVLTINRDVPHLLARMGPRVIHLSSDCVYDGHRGHRGESDPADATDLYGQSKAAGELDETYAHCVTIRTSFIGRDPLRKRGLLEWLIAQGAASSKVVGYTRAIWSGLAVAELARVFALVVKDDRLQGLYNVEGPVISKADLLELICRRFNICQQVERVDEPAIDRSLDGARFRAETGYRAPAWDEMVEDLAE